MATKKKSMTPRSEQVRFQFENEAVPYLSSVYNFALSLSRNPTVAEDLTQDTFLHAFRGFHNFKIGTSCRAWLMKICKNLFIDRIRRHGRRPSRVGLDNVEPEHNDASREVRAMLSSSMTSSWEDDDTLLDLFGDEINQHLEELPEEFRQALLLADIDGLSYNEITEIMGTPVGTVRSRISRARTFLRERLASYARNLGFLKWDPDDSPCVSC